MNQYQYDGPVLEFDRCISSRWRGITYAISKSKAKNNLTYQYKKQHNKANTCKISLPGNITQID